MSEGVRIIERAIRMAVEETDKFSDAEIADLSGEELARAACAVSAHRSVDISDEGADRFYETFGIAADAAIRRRRSGEGKLRVEDAIPGEWATRTQGDA